MLQLGNAIKSTLCSVDWGYTNPGVIQVWALDGDSRMYLVHEVYKTGMQIDWWIAKAKAANETYKPSIFVCDPSEPGFIDAFVGAGLRAFKAENSVLPGIEAVQMRIRRQEDGRARIYVSASACKERDPVLIEKKKPTCTAEEIAAYVWLPALAGKAPKEEPRKVDDHGLDAMRYAVAEVDQLGIYSAGAF